MTGILGKLVDHALVLGMERKNISHPKVFNLHTIVHFLSRDMRPDKCHCRLFSRLSRDSLKEYRDKKLCPDLIQYHNTSRAVKDIQSLSLRSLSKENRAAEDSRLAFAQHITCMWENRQLPAATLLSQAAVNAVKVVMSCGRNNL